MRNPSSTPSTSRTTKITNQTTTPCCVKIGLKKGPWTREEDEKLGNFIKKEGEGRWRTLPKRAGLLRCGKSCRLRWMNYLRPNVKRGQIAPDEEDLILRLHRLLGNRWSMIAGRIPGRTDNEIKNYWNTHLSKKLISQGIDPRTHKPLVSFDRDTNNNDDDTHPSSPKHNNIPVSQNPNPYPPNPSPSIALDETIVNHANHMFLNDTNVVVDDQDSEAQTNGMSNGDENNMNYCANYDGVFSSFLNAFINEDVFFSQHQPLQQVNHQSLNGDIEPLFATSDPLISYAQAFGLNTSNWETTMLPGFNLGNDPRKFDEHHV